MTTIEQLYPDPIPSIHPLPEYRVSGQRALWYAQTKEALQVLWMGVVTMAYAHYPNFFAELWRGLKPLCESRQLVDLCGQLRALVETRTVDLGSKSLVDELRRPAIIPPVRCCGEAVE